MASSIKQQKSKIIKSCFPDDLTFPAHLTNRFKSKTMGTVQVAFALFLCCLVDDIFASRRYSKTLRVTNGGPWGSWKYPSFCPEGSYAIGYKMKVCCFSITFS